MVCFSGAVGSLAWCSSSPARAATKAGEDRSRQQTTWNRRLAPHQTFHRRLVQVVTVLNLASRTVSKLGTTCPRHKPCRMSSQGLQVFFFFLRLQPLRFDVAVFICATHIAYRHLRIAGDMDCLPPLLEDVSGKTSAEPFTEMPPYGFAKPNFHIHGQCSSGKASARQAERAFRQTWSNR